MRKEDMKAHVITKVLDEYLQNKRAGENPDIEDYIERYPEYAKDIREAFSVEIDWMMKFSKAAERSEIISSEIEKEMGWQKVLVDLETRDSKESTSPKSSVFIQISAAIKSAFKSIKKFVFDPFGFIASIPRTVRFAIPALAVAVFVFLFVFTPTQNYSGLATIEKVPYVPLSFRGAEFSQEFVDGMEYYTVGKYPEAIQKLETAIETRAAVSFADPITVDTHFYLALSYLLNHDVDNGIDYLKRTIELGDDALLEICHWYLGNAYLLKEDGDKALLEFKKVSEIAGDYKSQADEMISAIEKIK